MTAVTQVLLFEEARLAHSRHFEEEDRTPQ